MKLVERSRPPEVCAIGEENPRTEAGERRGESVSGGGSRGTKIGSVARGG